MDELLKALSKTYLELTNSDLSEFYKLNGQSYAKDGICIEAALFMVEEFLCKGEGSVDRLVLPNYKCCIILDKLPLGFKNMGNK